LAPSLSQQSQILKERQEVLQAENVEVLQRVMQQRRDIENLVKGLENVVNDLDQSVAVLKPEDIDGLKSESRDMDEDMRMTG
jgi:kinetochore protein NNF1